MMFSTKQVRHLFVLKNKVATKALLADLGDYFVTKVFSADGPAMHFSYMGYNNVTHTDLIPISNIRRINYSPYHTLRKALPAVTITASGAGVVGTEYLLTLRFPEFISLTPEEDMTKTISFIFTSTGGNIATQLKAAIDTAFARDHNELITTAVVDATKVKITSNEQPWRLGLMENRPIRCIVQGLKAFTAGVESTWGTAADSSDVTVAFMKNGYVTADLEYFCMGARGDYYRQNGFPHTIDTEYVITKTDAKTKEYDYIDIHYFFQGEGLNNDYSEKVITFVAEAVDGADYETGDPIFDLEYWLDNTANLTDATTSHFSPANLPTPTALAVPIATITATQAVVDWVAGGSEENWVINYKRTSLPTWVAQDVETNSTYTLTGLTAGIEYELKVQAVKDDKTSAFSDIVTFTTKAT